MTRILDIIRAAQSAAQDAYREHAHLREAFSDPESAAFWVWVNTHGFKDVPQIRAALPPVPPPEVYRFSNTTDDWGYLLTAGNTYRMVVDILASVDRPIESLNSLLDFGCGPGRGVRCFLRHAEHLAVAGTDVDATAIAWCREALPFGRYEVNGELPPTAFDDRSFDAVFAVSVFSHLSEKSARAWLSELHRVLRPGGIAILTIHGPHALRRIANEPTMFKMIEVDRASFDEANRTVMEEEGFGFAAQPGGHLTTDLYGVAFIHPKHVERTWTKNFELLDIKVGAIDDWQDAVVLRAR